MGHSLKEKTITGMIWSAIGQVGTKGLSFISNLVLARLLAPEDFGCIAMLLVFVNIADICIQGGFGLALIQKKNVTQTDYSSVFYCNLGMSFVAYITLFFLAPTISSFYGMPQLCALLRVQSIQLLIGALGIVQAAQLKKALRFKELSKRSLLAAFCGLTVGVVMACLGFGAWSLIASATIAELVKLLLLWKMIPWKPSWIFSVKSIKELFSFGGLMMLSSIVLTLYDNIQNLIIGKFFSASSLGLVSQAKKLESIPSGAISTVVDQVSFPVFSTLQDNLRSLKVGLVKNVKCVQFLNVPLMLLLFVIARPLILFLYGEKWVGCVPYFQILCLSRLVYVLDPINMSVLKALGKSKLFFIALCIKLSVSVVLIIIGLQYGIMGMLCALAISPYFNFVFDSILNGKIINYGFWRQVKDNIPIFLKSILAGACSYCLSFITMNSFFLMGLQFVVFLGIYIGISCLQKDETLLLYKNILFSKIRNRK